MARYRLSREGREALDDVWRRLNSEPDARNPGDDDALARDDLDSWIAGVLSSNGRIQPDAMRLLFRAGAALPAGSKARAYYDEAHAIVLDADLVAGTRWPRGGGWAVSAARFIYMFVVTLLIQRFLLHRNGETAAATALSVAALWAFYYSVMDRRRA